ncbi:Lipase_GDSL domain-containing protein, partial [Cephalotus follicularis]
NVALFVFGDSLFDVGNNNVLNISILFKANFPPYGETFFRYPTGRFCDGRTIPDYVAHYANIPYWKPFLDPSYQNFNNGTNFASDGGTVLPEDNIETLHALPVPCLQPGANFVDGANFASAGAGALEIHSGVMNLKMQVTNFKKVASSLAQKLGEAEAKKILMRSVYLFSIGGNDYFSFNTGHAKATQSEQRDYMHLVIGNITNGVKEIYDIGGRKFGFQNVGPLGCLPMIRAQHPELNGTCVKSLLLHATLHNKALPNSLKKLESKLPGFKYSVFDYYNSLGDRIDNAKKYGFKEGKIACCGIGLYNARNCGVDTVKFKVCKNPKEYVFFDGGHTSERTNYQLANLMWSGVPNVTGPYNVKQLFELS